MFDIEGGFQLHGHIICIGWFLVEIFKSGYLIPIFLLYSGLVGFICYIFYKLFLKLGYNIEREKKQLKKNILNKIILAGLMFIAVFIFIGFFFKVCDMRNIALTDDLIQIKGYLAQQ